MNQTDQLRELLHRAAPEAPDVDACAAAAAGRRARNRRAAAGGALATAACVAVAAVTVPLVGGDDGADPAPATPSTYVDDRTQTVDAYTPAPCPTQIRADRVTKLPDLAGAAVVRLCLALGADPRGETPPLDALVTGLPELAEDLDALPEADPARCAAYSFVPEPLMLVVTVDGAPTRRVVVQTCGDVRLGDRTVAGEDVLAAYAVALDRQRDRFTYPPLGERELRTPTCRTPLSDAPFRPGRDRIESAVSCPPYDSGSMATPVTGEGLDRLRGAWARTPGQVGTDFEDPEPCTLDDDGQPFLMARLSAGDVVRMAGTDCERLVIDSVTAPGRHWQVPIALADVADES